jgi:hypothetical protein
MVIMRKMSSVLVAMVGFGDFVGATSATPVWSSMILNQIDQIMLYPPSGLRSAQRALEFGKRLPWMAFGL